jgi:hypothetical protein
MLELSGYFDDTVTTRIFLDFGESAGSLEKSGSPGRVRTTDQLINSQLLYR